MPELPPVLRLLPLLVLLTGCGNLPPWDPVAVRDLEVTAEYASNGEGETDFLALPVSGPHVKVLELRMEPAPLEERFDDRAHRVKPPPGTRSFRVTCRLRLYQQRDEDGKALPFPSKQTLFPGATIVQQQ